MAKGIRYSDDTRREWVRGYYAEDPRLPVATYKDKIGIATQTFTRALKDFRHEFETLQSQSSSSGSDLHSQFIASLPAEAYKQWLESEVKRLSARVKELEAQIPKLP